MAIKQIVEETKKWVHLGAAALVCIQTVLFYKIYQYKVKDIKLDNSEGIHSCHSRNHQASHL